MLAKSLRPVPRMTISEWADKYLYLPSTAAEPGRYKTSRTPYVKEIMNAFTDDEVQKIVFKSSSQSGKSQLLLAIIGRFAHLDPCNLMIVQPTLETAQDFSKDRLERMIKDSAVLTPLFYDLNKTRNSNQTILSKMYRGGRIVLVGANSPAGLASKPIRILLCDECDRYPASASEEGDPISLAEKRQTTYFNRKTALFSTPTVEGYSRIDKEYLLGTQEKWLHQCPNCGEYHWLDYRDMQVDFTEKIDELKNRTITVNSVNWRCPDCSFEFSELTMKNAAQKYVAENLDALKNGVRSFWVNGFSSTFLSWRQIMQEYLEAKGDETRERVVFNTRFGVSYQVRGEFQDENIFLQRREKYSAELPEEVLLLTAGVDVQANRLEIEICGWSSDESCYGILRGTIWGSPTKQSTWLELDKILDREYHFSGGKTLKVARTFIDSGFSTDEVYKYCSTRQVKGVFAIKGKGGAGLPLLYQFGKPKNANIILVILGVDTGKAEIFSRLAIEPPGAKSFHFPVDDELERGYDEIYFKELIAERLTARKSGGVINMTWEKINPKSRNESLDIRNYNLAAMKSCIGNLEPAEFWKMQAAVLREGEVENKKTTNKKIISREIDIFG